MFAVFFRGGVDISNDDNRKLRLFRNFAIPPHRYCITYLAKLYRETAREILKPIYGHTLFGSGPRRMILARQEYVVSE